MFTLFWYLCFVAFISVQFVTMTLETRKAAQATGMETRMSSNVLSGTRMDKTQKQRAKQQIWRRRSGCFLLVVLGYYYAASAGGFGAGVGPGVGGCSGGGGRVMATVHHMRGQIRVGVSEGVRACPIRTWSQFSERSTCCGGTSLSWSSCLTAAFIDSDGRMCAARCRAGARHANWKIGTGLSMSWLIIPRTSIAAR